MNISSVFLNGSKTLGRVYQLRNILACKFSSTNIDEKIEIPKRIPRGPTDILRALESTISRDPTAPRYKYHDDPYLIPMSNIEKRSFAMAQESGRKTAHWIRREHSELFNHKEADPIVEAFLPKVFYNANSKVSEDDLKKVISDAQVSDAQLIYGLLKEQGIEIAKDTEQELLELICYFNNEDTLSEFIEERWFKQSSNLKLRQRKTWKDGSFAEELFISIEDPSAEAYSAIIQGMNKYFQVNRAWQLFEEAKEKGLILSTDTYNSILRVVNFLKESFEMRWSLITNLLSEMNNLGLKPNLGTLNSVLYALSCMGSGKLVKKYALQVLREFKDLGIEPSLGTWYYVLITFCKERGPISTVLHDIIFHVENKEHMIKDTADTNFFVTAMDICRNHLRDVELAKRVDQFLHFGTNYNLIGDSYKESVYYRNYFILLANSLPFEQFMPEVYYCLVPNIYIPESSVVEEILNQVDLSGAIQYIPKLWSDMKIFDHSKREKLIEMILNIMLNNEPESDSDLSQKFSDISWDIYLQFEEQDENKYNKLSFTGDLLGKIMMLQLRNKDFSKACIIMDKLDKEQNTIVRVPDVEALSLFVDQCIEEKTPSRAIACIQYCSDNGFQEANTLAARLNEKLTLDENHLNKLAKVLGEVIMGQQTNLE